MNDRVRTFRRSFVSSGPVLDASAESVRGAGAGMGGGLYGEARTPEGIGSVAAASSCI